MLPDLLPIAPEILLAVGAMVLLMIGVFSGDDIAPPINGASIGLLAGAILILLFSSGRYEIFDGAFVLDGFARFMKIATLIGSAFAIAMSVGFAKAERF